MVTSPLLHQDMTPAFPAYSLPQNVPRTVYIAKETIQRVAIQFQTGTCMPTPCPSEGRDSGIHALSIVVRNCRSLPRNSCSALSTWRQTREDGDTTQADGKPGKLPIPLQHKRWSHKTPQMSSSAQCVGHNAEESFGLKKIN